MDRIAEVPDRVIEKAFECTSFVHRSSGIRDVFEAIYWTIGLDKVRGSQGTHVQQRHHS